jgi:hypothetical protein
MTKFSIGEYKSLGLGFLFGSISLAINGRSGLMTLFGGVFWALVFLVLRRLYLVVKKKSKPKSKFKKWDKLPTDKKVFWVGFVVGFISPLSDLNDPLLSFYDFPLSGAFIGFLSWLGFKGTKYLKSKSNKDFRKIITSTLTSKLKIDSQNKLLMIVIGLAILFAGENIISSYQYTKLFNKIETSENIMLSFNEMYREYPKEVKQKEYWGELLGYTTVTRYQYTKVSGEVMTYPSSTQAWDAWRQDMQSIGSIKKDDLLEAQFDIEQTFLFPWRTNKNTAKVKYLEHSDTWVNYFSSLINARKNSELTSFFEDDFGISPSFTIARKALNNGVSTIDLFRLESRMNKFFAKEGTNDKV